MTENTNIWLNGIMGVVVGDALGCPVQFESRDEVARHPVTGMRGYGTFNLPEGSWTDDSSLTIALLESIRRTGKIDLDDIMENFMKWLYNGEFTPYGESYDIGRGTMQAINRYRKNRNAKNCGGDEEWNNGNGSLMRIMPACLYCSVMESSGMYSDRDAIDAIHSVGGLTHAHIRSNIVKFRCVKAATLIEPQIFLGYIRIKNQDIIRIDCYIDSTAVKVSNGMRP